MTIGGYCCCRAITWPTRVQGRFQEATAYLVDSERAPECQLGGQPGHPPHCKQHQARPLLCLLCMMLPSVLLLVIGVLGAMDIVWFHSWKGRLASRPECRREVTLHVLRGLVYAAQFVAVPNVQFHGTWYFAWLLLFAADVSIAVADIWEEPQSRLAQGGLLRGEYLMHMVLSVLVGAMLCAAFSNSWSWFHQPTQVVWVTQVHWPLRALLALMAAVSIGVSVMEWLIVLESTWRRPDPLHVRVRLPAPVHQVWNVTQDHRFHPQWDHRFDSIVMCHEVDGEHQGPRFTPDPRITTGTLMRYEKRVLGVTIRGFGRYALHRPCRQSTFEFWSDDPRSLIRRGRGLWLYTPLPDGSTEFSTSYTYEVRWGAVGRLIDRFVFRPLFQRFTEASFRRLARQTFHIQQPRVLGALRGRPMVFA